MHDKAKTANRRERKIIYLSLEGEPELWDKLREIAAREVRTLSQIARIALWQVALKGKTPTPENQNDSR